MAAGHNSPCPSWQASAAAMRSLSRSSQAAVTSTGCGRPSRPRTRRPCCSLQPAPSRLKRATLHRGKHLQRAAAAGTGLPQAGPPRSRPPRRRCNPCRGSRFSECQPSRLAPASRLAEAAARSSAATRKRVFPTAASLPAAGRPVTRIRGPHRDIAYLLLRSRPQALGAEPAGSFAHACLLVAAHHGEHEPVGPQQYRLGRARGGDPQEPGERGDARGPRGLHRLQRQGRLRDGSRLPPGRGQEISWYPQPGQTASFSTPAPAEAAYSSRRS